MRQDEWKSSPEEAQTLDRLGLEFLAGMLETEVGRRPQNLPALHDLGHVYTRLERHEAALSVDEELVRRLPEDPTARYNLACSLALLGRAPQALDALERAVELGYDDAEHLLADEDLAGLRGEERFRSLAARLARTD